MKSALRLTLVALVLSALSAAAGGDKYSLKTAAVDAPKELNANIAKLLGKEAIQFYDPKGELICEVWLRQAVPGDATADQVKNGLTYREIPETTVMGAIRFAKKWADYKKQPLNAGVYTLRLAYQPQDGDHMGTAPHTEFFIVTGASKDTKDGVIEKKEMIEKSAESIKGSHPAILLLFPHSKPGVGTQLANRPNQHVTINTKTTVSIKGQKSDTALGLALTLVGHTE